MRFTFLKGLALILVCQLALSALCFAQNGPFSQFQNYSSAQFLGRLRATDPRPQYTTDRLILTGANAAGLIKIGFANFPALEMSMRPLITALEACQPEDQFCIDSHTQQIYSAYNASMHVVSTNLNLGEEIFLQGDSVFNTLRAYKKDSLGQFELLATIPIQLIGSTIAYPAQQMTFAAVAGAGPVSNGGGYSKGIDLNLPATQAQQSYSPSVAPACRVLVLGGGSFSWQGAIFGHGIGSMFPTPLSNLYPVVKSAVDEFNFVMGSAYGPAWQDIPVNDVWYDHSESISDAADEAHGDIQAQYDRGEKLMFVNHCQGSLVGNTLLERFPSTYYNNDRTFRVITIDPPFTGISSMQYWAPMYYLGLGAVFFPIAADIESPTSGVLSHMSQNAVPKELRYQRKKLNGQPYPWEKPGMYNDNWSARWDHTPWLDPQRNENAVIIAVLKGQIQRDLYTNCLYHYPTGPLPPAPQPGIPNESDTGLHPSTPGSCSPGAPGFCLPRICGDGLLSSGEECDDGNTNSGDGCSADCVVEFCGDGIAQGGLNEECDDGNTIPGDGCDDQCKIEQKPTPTPSPTPTPQDPCGNGSIEPGEQCELASDCPLLGGPGPNGVGCAMYGADCKSCQCVYPHFLTASSLKNNCSTGLQPELLPYG